MTKDDIISIEWLLANAEAAGLGDTPEGSEHLARLAELRWEAMLHYTRFCGDRADLIGFMKKWAITIPMKEFDQWRMALPQDQRVGEITGLPESRGILRCTNGIMCYIERTEKFPYFGHIQHWKPDPLEGGRILVGRGAKQNARQREIAVLFEGLT